MCKALALQPENMDSVIRRGPREQDPYVIWNPPEQSILTLFVEYENSFKLKYVLILNYYYYICIYFHFCGQR